MRKPILVFLVFFVFMILARKCHSCLGDASNIRIIDVCVLNDVSAPVSEEIIDKVIEPVFAEYKNYMGIDFHAHKPVLEYRYDVTNWPIDQAFYLQKVCPSQFEIRIVFTNQGNNLESEEKDSSCGCNSQEINGYSHPYFGHVFLYNVDNNFKLIEPGGEQQVIKTFKHELGHLFLGHWHSDDTNSFMYPCNSKNKGQWTREVLDKIKENIAKMWFPRA